MKEKSSNELLFEKYFYNNLRKAVLIFILFGTSFTMAQNILLSEVMFMPNESNSEFIELVNVSASPINLAGYKIKYHTTSPDEIVSLQNNYILFPNEYAVIFEADYDFQNGVYKSLIPDSVLVFVLDDNAFGSGGMANTSDRSVYLISALDDTLDAYTYSADNNNGYSDERVSVEDSVWLNSITQNGSPGLKNSVTAVEYDASIIKFYADYTYYDIGSTVELNFLVKNLGTLDLENIELLVYADSNNNGIGELNEIVFSQIIQNISTNDSLTTIATYNNIVKGRNNFIAEIKFIEDENLFNNISYVTIIGIAPNEDRGNIIVNEIMYAPNNSEPEWIEIYNKSAKEINLNGYRVADNSDTVNAINEDIKLKPNQYLVIADDSLITQYYLPFPNLIISKLPTLNNSGDKIIVMDSLNRVIDSLEYFSDWGGTNGNSLEKIDASLSSLEKESWINSNFPTPGKINSVTQKDYDLIVDSVYSNPKYPLVDTDFKIIAVVKNIGKKEAEFTLELYSDTNQDSLTDKIIEESELFRIRPNEKIQYEFLFESKIEQNKQLFIVDVNTNDDDTTNNKYILELNPSYSKNTLVVNEIMYSPGNYEPEWIELYNNSDYEIDLFNWSVGDVLTNPVFKSINNSLLIKSKEYLIISKSNSIYNFHRNIESRVIELSFANLNNDEDGVVIKDFNGKTIDSLRYVNEWSTISGHSLERISIHNSSVNENNWSSSLSIEGSSPGGINSVTSKDYDLVIKSIYTEPEFPVEGEKIKLFTDIENRGENSADDFRVEFFIMNENGNSLIEKVENLSLSSEDSITIETINEIIINDTTKIFVQVSFIHDEDLNNNYLEKLLIPGFNRNTVLLSEIMFKPKDDEPEWIEIINNSDSVVNLKNWLVGDSRSKAIITETDILLDPNDYLIISDNIEQDNFFSRVVKTNLPDLSNTKDEVIIYDYRNAIIDSMNYNVPSTYSNSVSLERVSLAERSDNVENWSFSINANGSTPGNENSVSGLPDYNYGDLIFTEIMFEPSEMNSEFLEFYNNSDEPIEIGGWSISDDKERLFTISSTQNNLEAHNFFTVSSDSLILNNYSWLSNSKELEILNTTSLNLTNTDKLLYLKDVKNNIIDSLHYFNSWHNKSLLETKDISLELINFNLDRNRSANWSSSVAEKGATPGKANSINVENIVSKAKIEITPNPFSPDNDGFEDFSFINYNLTQPISQIRIRVYDSKGRLVRTLTDNQLVGNKGTILFDGLNERKNPLSMGIYIILFEAVNSNNVVVEVLKEVVVVARKL